MRFLRIVKASLDILPAKARIHNSRYPISSRKKQKLSLFIVSLILFFSGVTYAWDDLGHRLIADIAYNQLTPSAKKVVNQLTFRQDRHLSPRNRFLLAATWPDGLRSHHMHAFDRWHYVNFNDPDWANQHQVAWAITEAKNHLKSNISPEEKAFWLTLLIHFVGDIHQPLHCGIRPDRGGNQYPIRAGKAHQLHQYWDQGLGLFQEKQVGASYLAGTSCVQLLKAHPATDPVEWAQESTKVAQQYAYQIPIRTKPSVDYQNQGRQQVTQRIALAGCRLGKMLNELF